MDHVLSRASWHRICRATPPDRRVRRKLSAMTLSISSFCEMHEGIAYLFDEQLTTTESAADVASKGVFVHPRWLLTFSGEYIGQVGAVVDKVKRALATQREWSVSGVERAIIDAQSRTFIEEVVPAVLPPGWKFDEFRRDGVGRLGEATFLQLQQALDQAR